MPQKQFDMDISIEKYEDRFFLRIDNTSVEIKNYKISSSAHGRTEFEVVFEFDNDIMEFWSKASLAERLQQTQ